MNGCHSIPLRHQGARPKPDKGGPLSWHIRIILPEVRRSCITRTGADRNAALGHAALRDQSHSSARDGSVASWRLQRWPDKEQQPLSKGIRLSRCALLGGAIQRPKQDRTGACLLNSTRGCHGRRAWCSKRRRFAQRAQWIDETGAELWIDAPGAEMLCRRDQEAPNLLGRA